MPARARPVSLKCPLGEDLPLLLPAAAWVPCARHPCPGMWLQQLPPATRPGRLHLRGGDPAPDAHGQDAQGLRRFAESQPSPHQGPGGPSRRTELAARKQTRDAHAAAATASEQRPRPAAYRGPPRPRARAQPLLSRAQRPRVRSPLLQHSAVPAETARRQRHSRKRLRAALTLTGSPLSAAKSSSVGRPPRRRRRTRGASRGAAPGASGRDAPPAEASKATGQSLLPERLRGCWQVGLTPSEQRVPPQAPRHATATLPPRLCRPGRTLAPSRPLPRLLPAVRPQGPRCPQLPGWAVTHATCGISEWTPAPARHRHTVVTLWGQVGPWEPSPGPGLLLPIRTKSWVHRRLWSAPVTVGPESGPLLSPSGHGPSCGLRCRAPPTETPVEQAAAPGAPSPGLGQPH